MQIYLLYTHHNQLTILFAIVAQSIVYISSCVNPILYVFLFESFRKALKQFLTCSKLLLNQNGNETMITGKILSYRVMQQQQQQQTKKSLLSKSNVNNDHRMKIESNSTTISLKPIKDDRLSNVNVTSIR